ncbi:DUF3159 domain-containing protein [Amycolatopsis dongchuanensis]|uniref:DUF3159 domain-containing protein n=1 Tax=Amycolatopsis dongchuanensis TaxID=1070866 RepID=A0ABP8VRU4_9PSEU
MTTTRRPVRPSGQDLRRHLADALVPNVAFLVGYKLTGVLAGVAAAVVAGLVLVVLRLLRRRGLTVVFAAFGLVLLHAVTVLSTGEGRDYFLPWLLLNSALTVVFVLSLALRRPITARLRRFGGSTGDTSRHTLVTALWAGLWALHLVVGLPLYFADMVVALGVAHFVLGPPALLALGLLTWRLLSRTPAYEAGGSS